MVYSGPPGLLVFENMFPATVYIFMSATPTTQVSVNPTFLDLKNVRPNKEMGGNLAKLVGFQSMADLFSPLYLIISMPLSSTA